MPGGQLYMRLVTMAMFRVFGKYYNIMVGHSDIENIVKTHINFLWQFVKAKSNQLV